MTGYRIYRGADGSSGAPLVTIGNVLSFTDTTVANGATFWYSVSAISVYGEGTRSAAAVAQRALPPTAPTSPVAGVATGRTGITVSWQAPTSTGGSPVTGYRIYRSPAAGGTFPVTVGAGTTTFTDTAVTKKVTYFYRLTAVNAVGESALSVEVNATAR